MDDLERDRSMSLSTRRGPVLLVFVIVALMCGAVGLVMGFALGRVAH